MNLRRNTLQLTAANFIQLLFSLFQNVIFSRLIAEKNDFGKLQQVALISTLLVTSIAAIPNSINYFFGLYGLTKDNAGELIRRFSFISFLNAIVFGGLVLIFKNQLSDLFSNDIFLSYTGLIAALIFLRVFNIIYQNICLLKGKLTFLIFVNTVQSLLLFSVFIFRDDNGYVSVGLLLKVLVFTELIKSIAVMITVSPHFKKISKLNLTGNEWRYIVYLLLNAVLMAVGSQIDRLIVSFYGSPESYSDYSLGTFANPMIGVILASISTSFIPVLSNMYARKDTSGILALWKRISAQGAAVVLPLVVFTIFFGNDIVIFLFSGKYQGAGPLFQLFNCKYLLIFIVFSLTMNAIGLEKYTFLNSLVNVITTSVAVFIGLKYFGAKGAIAGGIVAIYLGYIFPVFLVNKKLKCSLGDYFPFRAFLLTLLLSVVIAGCFLMISRAGMIDSTITVVIIGPLYYLIVLLLVNKYAVNIVDLKNFNALKLFFEPGK